MSTRDDFQASFNAQIPGSWTSALDGQELHQAVVDMMSAADAAEAGQSQMSPDMIAHVYNSDNIVDSHALVVDDVELDHLDRLEALEGAVLIMRK